MKLLLLTALFGFFFAKPDAELVDEVALQVIEHAVDLQLKEGELDLAVPAEQLGKAIFLPNAVVRLDEAGSVSGSFKQGKKQVFGEEGKPDLEALATWLKKLPDEKTVSIKVAGGAPQKHLIGIINALNEAGIDQVTFTDILVEE